MYYIICLVWPTSNQKLIKDMGLRWEEEYGDVVLAPDGTEIIEEGNVVRAKSQGSDGHEVGQEIYSAQKY